MKKRVLLSSKLISATTMILVPILPLHGASPTSNGWVAVGVGSPACRLVNFEKNVGSLEVRPRGALRANLILKTYSKDPGKPYDLDSNVRIDAEQNTINFVGKKHRLDRNLPGRKTTLSPTWEKRTNKRLIFKQFSPMKTIDIFFDKKGFGTTQRAKSKHGSLSNRNFLAAFKDCYPDPAN